VRRRIEDWEQQSTISRLRREGHDDKSIITDIGGRRDVGVETRLRMDQVDFNCQVGHEREEDTLIRFEEERQKDQNL